MRWRWRRRIEDSARRSGHGQPARINGFSLHAAVRCDADDRQALEQLCRTITCPAQETRTRAMQRRRPGRAQAEDALARRHHAPGDVAAGVRSRGRLRPQLCATGQRDPIVRVGPQFIPARGLFSPCSPAAHRLLGGGQWLRCPRPSDQVPEPAPTQSGKELLNFLSSVLLHARLGPEPPHPRRHRRAALVAGRWAAPAQRGRHHCGRATAWAEPVHRRAQRRTARRQETRHLYGRCACAA